MVPEEIVPSELNLDLDTDVLQLSVGGMLAETPLRLDVGSRHAFSFLIDGAQLKVTGTIRHCNPAEPAGDTNRYRVGVQFAGLGTEEQERLQKFVRERSEN